MIFLSPERLKIGLKELCSWHPGVCTWKPKTMQKLNLLGYAKREGDGYVLTECGIKLAKEMGLMK